jgi:hypothetical protein
MYIKKIININNKCSFGKLNTFNALSPLDGRYANTLKNSVSNYFSEAALMKYRIKVEA